MFSSGSATNAQSAAQSPAASPAKGATAKGATARELYSQAAKALVSKDIEQATTTLTQLVDHIPKMKWLRWQPCVWPSAS